MVWPHLKSADFAVFARSRSFRFGHLRASVVYRSGRKYGVVAGKKVSPLSVRRNKVKRRLRHILRGLWQQLPQNAWIVFIALPGAAVVGFNELEKDFIELVGRINTPKSGNSVDKVV